MRAAIYRRSGAPADVVEVGDVRMPGPVAEGHVMVRMVLAPVHRGDLVGIQTAAGEFKPRRLGTEGVGFVVALGGGVDGLRMGDRVAVFPAVGTWAERVMVPSGSVVVVPEGVADEVAAVMLVNSITAEEVLRAVLDVRRRVGAAEQDPLVVSAAASGVGRLIIRAANRYGLDTIGVVRSDRSRAAAERYSPTTPVVAMTDPHWRDQLSVLIGSRGVPAVADAHGGAFIEAAIGILAPAGSVILWGDLSGQPWPITTGMLLGDELNMQAVSISRWATRSPQTQLDDIARAAETAQRAPQLLAVGPALALDEIGDAVGRAVAGFSAGLPLLRLTEAHTASR